MPIPVQENYSIRCRISHRPKFQTTEPIFFRCSHCGAVTVVNPRPNGCGEQTVSCCGEEMEKLTVCKDESIKADHALKYTVFGGFERNAIQIAVDGGSHPMMPEHRIEWMYLRSFQGGQLKFMPEKSRSKANFAMADEDSYVYCDRPVCKMGREHCQFQCKRGMVAYAYCNVHGLMRIELAGE